MNPGEFLQALRSVDHSITREDLQRSQLVDNHGLDCLALTELEFDSWERVKDACNELQRRAVED